MNSGFAQKINKIKKQTKNISCLMKKNKETTSTTRKENILNLYNLKELYVLTTKSK